MQTWKYLIYQRKITTYDYQRWSLSVMSLKTNGTQLPGLSFPPLFIAQLIRQVTKYHIFCPNDLHQPLINDTLRVYITWPHRLVV